MCDIVVLLNIKKQYPRLPQTNPQQFDALCVSRCQFLFNNYTDIYNKILKDELNLQILSTFLNTLKQIEDGKLDQHEASFEVGKILKKLYIDSALRKSEHNDAKFSKKKKKQIKSRQNLSWAEYKLLQNTTK